MSGDGSETRNGGGAAAALWPGVSGAWLAVAAKAAGRRGGAAEAGAGSLAARQGEPAPRGGAAPGR